MARIPMTSGFQVLPEGEQILRIYDQSYDENFGKLIINLVNANGIKHREQYMLMGKDGQPNEGAMNAFSYFAKNAMNNFEMLDIDPAELVNHYVKANVTHDVVPSTKDPSKNYTYARLGDLSPASGFESDTAAEAPTAGGLDLASLLGN